MEDTCSCFDSAPSFSHSVRISRYCVSSAPYFPEGIVHSGHSTASRHKENSAIPLAIEGYICSGMASWFFSSLVFSPRSTAALSCASGGGRARATMAPTSCVVTIVGDPLFPLGLGSLCYGCFTILFILSSNVLLATDKTGHQRKARVLLFLATFLMFSVSTAHLIVFIIYAGMYPRLQHELTPKDLQLSKWLKALILFLPGVNSGLSDIVVAWRAWLLWGRTVRIFLTVWILAGFVAAPVAYRANICYGQIVGFSSSVFNNMVSISLVAYKAWEHRQFVRIQLEERRKRTKIERILLLLVQLGAAYTLAWTLYAVGQFTPVVPLNDVMLVAIVHISLWSQDQSLCAVSKWATAVHLEYLLVTTMR
ncbi:hypothetical protein EVG20_g8869 [Dentipellis fragilis]|uniref:Uncharacterized protein n=1 Tax=Dentipellis fragilis TaxID=205917 RepID=A0A4Y9Y3U9_9AGAM|nr:hypothetical protein EVG20_g8869 [Dentipellis fragilis]